MKKFTPITVALFALLSAAIYAQSGQDYVTVEEVEISVAASGTVGSTDIAYGEGRKLVGAVADLPNGTATTWTISITSEDSVDLLTWGSLAENDEHYLEIQDASEISSSEFVGLARGYEVEATAATTEASAVTVYVTLFYE